MTVSHLLAVLLTLAGPTSPDDTTRQSPPRSPDGYFVDLAGVRRQTDPLAIAPLDTPRARPRATEVSEWYERRMVIHRVTALVVPALFLYQYSLGSKLYDAEDEGRAAPAWVRPAHRRGATAIAAAFGVNTVTGLWNLWESRDASDGQGRRVVHALSMLGAMGGFTYAGMKLADDAQKAPNREAAMDKRRQHRNVALASMGVTVVSGTAMWLLNR